MNPYIRLYVIIPTILLISGAAASIGDRSLVYNNCLRPCKLINGCSTNETKPSKDWYSRLVLWDCESECRYDCMWHAVQAFQKDATPIPQFHGKWPFIRIMGLQEPASVLFSILNGLSVIIGVYKLRKHVHFSAPMYYVWQIYGLVCVNAWFWSVVFHARDTPFTEKMDYFCALSLVLASFYTLIIRTFSTERRHVVVGVGTILLAFYVNHCIYMTWRNFNYSYNMIVNIAVGLINNVGWLFWCYKRRHRSYVRKCVVTTLAISALLLLEVCDFRPLWWVFDAHALWHAGTVPLPLIWFSFASDDCVYLYKMVKTNNNVTYKKPSVNWSKLD